MVKKISVAMATFNGEKYLEEQLDSILLNLTEQDELVISDDGSKDKTIEILRKYQKKDNRIKILEGPKLGVKKNFENAIKNTTGDIIFLSDQDDVWKKNKVKKTIEILKKTNCTVVLHNAAIVNQNLESINQNFFEFRNSKKGKIKNIIKNSYIGCCMAFDSKLKDKILPIPNNIEMHDQWIGILAEKYGKCELLNDELILYRRHDNNVSKMEHHPINKMIKNRLIFIKEYIRR